MMAVKVLAVAPEEGDGQRHRDAWVGTPRAAPIRRGSGTSEHEERDDDAGQPDRDEGRLPGQELAQRTAAPPGTAVK